MGGAEQMFGVSKIFKKTILFQQGCITLIKSDSDATKLSSTTVFNIDNNKKCFLSTKTAHKNDF